MVSLVGLISLRSQVRILPALLIKINSLKANSFWVSLFYFKQFITKTNKQMTKQNSIITKDQFDLQNLKQGDIPALLAKVDQRIKSIKGEKDEVPMKTTSLPGFGDLEKQENVSELNKAYSMIMKKSEAYLEAAKETELDLKKYPFKESDVSAKMWLDYIKRRIKVQQNKDALTKLTTMKNTLETTLSEEEKTKRALQSVVQMLFEDDES